MTGPFTDALLVARGLAVARGAAGGRGLRAERGVRVVRLDSGTTLRFGEGVRLAYHVGLHLRERGALLEIGDGTFVNHRSEVVAHQEVRIGAGCLLAWDVLVLDGNSHLVEGSVRAAPVVVGDRVWIGARATVLPGVTIGDGAVVAACAVVAGDVPARALVAGNPAQVVREDVSWQE